MENDNTRGMWRVGWRGVPLAADFDGDCVAPKGLGGRSGSESHSSHYGPRTVAPCGLLGRVAVSTISVVL